MGLPGKSTKVLALRESPLQQKPLYHDLLLEERDVPALRPGEILVKITAAAFNHRDLWIRLGRYPGIVIGSVLGGDGAGVVVASADVNDSLLQKRVFLTPARGWESDPDAPESTFGLLGGGRVPPLGTFAEYVVVERDQVVLAPDYLSDVQVAAWPTGGLTAWRAAVLNGEVNAGHNVLITGIGGGVAIFALQICLARGATVYVTSGSPEKIQKAVALGARGGANYKEQDWPAQIADLLKKNPNGNGLLDTVIDSGGGDIMAQTGKLLKQGGRVVCYGMTASPKITFTMREVLKNQKLIGSTMGSHKDLIDATDFMVKHRIVPVISHVLDGLESAEEGFELLTQGSQCGKIVIKIRQESDGATEAKL